MGLETVELILSVEEEFGLSIPNTEAAKLATVGALSSYIRLQLEEQHLRTLSEAEAAAIWERLKQIVVEQFGVRPELVTPSAFIVDDLRID